MSTDQPQSANVTVEPVSSKTVPPASLRELYDQYKWWPERSLEDIEAMFSRGPAFGAWANGQLVGFGRAVSDGQFRAFIEDVLVRPDYRKQGVATKIMSALMDELSDVDQISLICSEEHRPVYERSGFKQEAGEVVMHRRKDS